MLVVDTLDELDKKIMADLSNNCRISYQELSRRYGISANAIRRRIINLEVSGEIYDYAVSPSSAMVGCDRLFGLATADGSRDEIEMIDEIGSNPNILAAAAYSNGTYAFIGDYRSPQELLELSSFIRRIPSVTHVEIHPIITSQGTQMELTPLHLRILKPLIDEPRLSVVEVADKTGLTARRVRRLLTQLEESGAIHFRALLELGAATSIPFLARITYDEQKANYESILDWMRKRYPLKHWENFVSAAEPVIFALLSVESLVEVNDVTRDIRQNESVKSVITIISKYHKFYRGISHNLLRDMIEANERKA